MPGFLANVRAIRSRGDRWRIVLLLCLAVVPYVNSLHNDLVYDDRAVVTENKQVRSLNPLVILRPGLNRYAVEWYRPLTMFSFGVNYRFGGLDPVGYHIANVLLHAASVWLLYCVALRVLPSSGVAALAAGLFAVHPIHVEAVTPASGRADLLATVFVLLAWHLALEIDRTPTWRRAASVAAAGFVALLAKESAIIVWPLIAISDLGGLGWSMSPRSTPFTRVQSRSKVHVALALALGAYLLFRATVTGSVGAVGGLAIRPLENPLVGARVDVRLATAAWVLAKYCALLVVPVGLSADYSFNQIPLVTSWTDPRLAASIVLISALCAVAAATWRRQRAIAVLLLLFLVLWLPVSNLVLTIGTNMAERLMYLPSVAFALLVGAAAHRIRPDTDRIGPALATIVAAVAGIQIGLTVNRNRDWRSQEVLFSNTVRRSPDSAKAHFNYGTTLLESGVIADAEREFLRAIQIAQDYPEAHNGLGTVLLRMRKLDEAEAEFREAVRNKPDLASAWANLGITLFRSGRDIEADPALRKAIELNPGIAIAHANLGAVAERQGHLQLAIGQYLETYRLEPTFEGLGSHLVGLLITAGRQAEAEALARELRRSQGLQ